MCVCVHVCVCACVYVTWHLITRVRWPLSLLSSSTCVYMRECECDVPFDDARAVAYVWHAREGWEQRSYALIHGVWYCCYHHVVVHPKYLWDLVNTCIHTRIHICRCVDVYMYIIIYVYICIYYCLYMHIILFLLCGRVPHASLRSDKYIYTYMCTYM